MSSSGISDTDYDSDAELGNTLDEVNYQDWDTLAGDFTKRYNRMKQKVVASYAPQTRKAPTAMPAQNHIPAPPAASTSKAHLDKVAQGIAHLSMYEDKVNLEPLFKTSATQTRKGGAAKAITKDKSERATNEQVLDPRTRLVLFKMLNRELFNRIDGCVSTGKEANVYHAVASVVKNPAGEVIMAPKENEDTVHLAIKIFKTSILVFKDRDKYVTGEYRFKSGYAKSNPRKMVRLWAEKELRNLRRLAGAGLRVPRAVEVRENVLVMEFLVDSDDGNDWASAPRLKDAALPADRIHGMYVDMLVAIRLMYTKARLVHADLSEYNILYHGGELWIIDVSQSVEHDHPYALDFIRSDIQNMDEFFARRGVQTLGVKRTFDFVTDTRMLERDALLPIIDTLLRDSANAPDETEDAVFSNAYIPQTLQDVYDPERDIEKAQQGQELIYGKLVQSDSESGDDTSDESESEASLDASESSKQDRDGVQRPRGKKFEDREEKKQRHKELKEANREKRKEKKSKMTKGEKVRRMKKTSGKKK